MDQAVGRPMNPAIAASDVRMIPAMAMGRPIMCPRAQRILPSRRRARLADGEFR